MFLPIPEAIVGKLKQLEVFIMAEATFKVVGFTQYRENYGAHCWDGEGECPQYWKYKGGNEYLVMDGITSEMLCNTQAILDIMDEIMKNHEYRDEYSSEEFIDYEIVPTSEFTPFEKRDLEMLQEGY